MNCLIATVIAFIALTEARNAQKPRLHVYEIRQDTQDEDLSSSGDNFVQPKHNYVGQSGLKKRLSAHRDKKDETLSLLRELLKTLQQQQQSKYSFVDKTRSDYDDEQPKRSLNLANLVLRNGDSRVTVRPAELRTGAPIHRYAYRGAGDGIMRATSAPDTSSDSSD